MYDQFYGLKGRPFQLTPDPHFYFESITHRKAMSYLGYGLAQGEGFIVITGEIGSGKTTLVGHLMATIDPARLTAVKLVSTRVDGDDMLRLAAQGFGIPTEGAAKAQLLQRIEAWLHGQARAGRRTLLIVDEAQNLSPEGLEELRMLSNFQLGGQALLQIFLLGQPEFRDMLNNAAELEQVRQRVIATHHLDAMQPNETQPYILHRLSLVGWTGNPSITPEAFAAIHRASGGIPRRINAIASRVLLLGAIDQLAVLDEGVVDAVVADMTRDVEGEGAPAAEPAPIPAFEPIAVPVAAESVEPFAEPHFFAPVAEAEPEVETALEIEPAPEPAVAAFFEPEFAPVPAPVVHVEEPVTPAPIVSLQDLHAIREELADLRAALAAVPAVDPSLAGRLEQLELRMETAEKRADEQDVALRRVLTLLVEWVEHDERGTSALRQGLSA